MSYVIKPEDLESFYVHENVPARVVGNGKNMTALMTWWPPDTSFSIHTHPHEQIGIVVQGQPVITIDGRDYQAKEGDVYHIPSNVPHTQRNEGPGQVIFFECFAPVREDLLRRKFEQKIVE